MVEGPACPLPQQSKSLVNLALSPISEHGGDCRPQGGRSRAQYGLQIIDELVELQYNGNAFGGVRGVCAIVMVGKYVYEEVLVIIGSGGTFEADVQSSSSNVSAFLT